MQNNNTIIGQILPPVNRRKFKRIVDKYKGDFATKKLRCWDQFFALLLGQLGPMSGGGFCTLPKKTIEYCFLRGSGVSEAGMSL